MNIKEALDVIIKVLEVLLDDLIEIISGFLSGLWEFTRWVFDIGLKVAPLVTGGSAGMVAYEFQDIDVIKSGTEPVVERVLSVEKRLESIEFAIKQETIPSELSHHLLKIQQQLIAGQCARCAVPRDNRTTRVKTK